MMMSRMYTKRVLVLGCGNILFGNDGFGPEVIQRIKSVHALPGDVLVMDVGTGVRDLVFDLLLADKKPDCIWIADAVSIKGKNEGELFELPLAEMPGNKLSNFSLHQSPSSNLLAQLKDQGVAIKILGMQTHFIPNEIRPGLSQAAQRAVRPACDWIVKDITRTGPGPNGHTDRETCL